MTGPNTEKQEEEKTGLNGIYSQSSQLKSQDNIKKDRLHCQEVA